MQGSHALTLGLAVLLRGWLRASAGGEGLTNREDASGLVTLSAPAPSTESSFPHERSPSGLLLVPSSSRRDRGGLVLRPDPTQPEQRCSGGVLLLPSDGGLISAIPPLAADMQQVVDVQLGLPDLLSCTTGGLAAVASTVGPPEVILLKAAQHSGGQEARLQTCYRIDRSHGLDSLSRCALHSAAPWQCFPMTGATPETSIELRAGDSVSAELVSVAAMLCEAPTESAAPTVLPCQGRADRCSGLCSCIHLSPGALGQFV